MKKFLSGGLVFLFCEAVAYAIGSTIPTEIACSCPASNPNCCPDPTMAWSFALYAIVPSLLVALLVVRLITHRR